MKFIRNIRHGKNTKMVSPNTLVTAKSDRCQPFEYHNKLDASRGVHCSNAALTTESDRSCPITADPCSAGSNYEWTSSTNDDNDDHMPTYTIHSLNSESFHRGEIRLRDSDDAEEKEDQWEWERSLLVTVVKEKRKTLPISSLFMANCHVLINNERAKRFILPLIRETELDKVASERAELMMKEGKCEHSDIENLITKISELTPPWQRIGENVCRGKSILDIHHEIMVNPDCIADKNNIHERRFSSFGIGVATSSEGEVYVCQIFKG